MSCNILYKIPTQVLYSTGTVSPYLFRLRQKWCKKNNVGIPHQVISAQKWKYYAE